MLFILLDLRDGLPGRHGASCGSGIDLQSLDLAPIGALGWTKTARRNPEVALDAIETFRGSNAWWTERLWVIKVALGRQMSEDEECQAMSESAIRQERGCSAEALAEAARECPVPVHSSFSFS